MATIECVTDSLAQLRWTDADPNRVFQGDCAQILPTLPAEQFQLIYIDPPFNTGRRQQRVSVKSTRDPLATRVGFGGNTYVQTRERLAQYDDSFSDYWAFLEPKLQQAWRLLTGSGTLYVHLDYRESHYVKVMLDAMFGRENFLNEIVWAYDYGARAKSRWPTKHDTILVYVKDHQRYYFDNAEVDREPYMAPGLVTPEKAAKGKLPTDVWWHTIVSPTGREKTGYPTQKPEALVRRAVQASTQPNDWVLDFFAGSGTLGAVATKLGRRFVLVDRSNDAIETIRTRLAGLPGDAETVFESVD